jgi:hypothetical protein
MRVEMTKLARAPTKRNRDWPKLRLTPAVWAKLVFWRDIGETEIAAFGVTDPDDPLLVIELHLVKQQADWLNVAIDDAALADYFDEQVDLGRQPCEFARVWLHTHPGDSAYPSSVDEATFERAFGNTDGAIMAIVAAGGQVYARRNSVGQPERLSLVVDFSEQFEASDQEAWFEEYEAKVERTTEQVDSTWEYDAYDHAQYERDYAWEREYEHQLSQGFDFDSPWPNPSAQQGAFEWW